MIRRGEVDLDWEALLEKCVVVELGAIVERERVEVAAVATNRTRGSSRHLLLSACAQLFDDCVAGLTLDQRKHTMAQIATHHGVAFPMADLLPSFHLDRPLVNGAFAWQYASRIAATIAFAPE